MINDYLKEKKSEIACFPTNTINVYIKVNLRNNHKQLVIVLSCVYD